MDAPGNRCAQGEAIPHHNLGPNFRKAIRTLSVYKMTCVSQGCDCFCVSFSNRGLPAVHTITVVKLHCV